MYRLRSPCLFAAVPSGRFCRPLPPTDRIHLYFVQGIHSKLHINISYVEWGVLCYLQAANTISFTELCCQSLRDLSTPWSQGSTTKKANDESTASIFPTVCAFATFAMMELAGSGLAGVRHLQRERVERRRPRTTSTARPRAVPGAGGFSHTPTIEGGPLPRAPRVSPRQRRRVEDTHIYLCARVDPVMGPLILALMEGRPEDIREAALEHLLSKRGENDAFVDGEMGATMDKPEGPSSVNGGDDRAPASPGKDVEAAAQHHRRLTRRQDRLFMAREIGPLVTELIRLTLHYMPTDVENFLIEQLYGGTIPDGTAAGQAKYINSCGPFRPPKNQSNHNLQSRPTRPSTARSRLQQAQSLDLQVQQASAPLSGRATEARRSPSPPRCPKSGGLSDEDGACDRDPQAAPHASRSPRGSGGRAVVIGVKESQNKPWDVEVHMRSKVKFHTP